MGIEKFIIFLCIMALIISVAYLLEQLKIGDVVFSEWQRKDSESWKAFGDLIEWKRQYPEHYVNKKLYRRHVLLLRQVEVLKKEYEVL